MQNVKKINQESSIRGSLDIVGGVELLGGALRGVQDWYFVEQKISKRCPEKYNNIYMLKLSHNPFTEK